MSGNPTARYRIPRQRISLVREATIGSEWKTYHNSREVFEFAREHLFPDSDREQFYTMMVDSKNRLIGVNMVSQGSLSQSVIHPREVFKPAVVASAAAVLFVHNHPSGDSTPSREDRECTERLVHAGKILGIRVLDHVVCGQADYFSFQDAGIIDPTAGGS